MKKNISIIIGVILIVISVALAIVFIQSKAKSKPNLVKEIKIVSVKKVTNGEIPIVIKASGSLIAKNKIEIYSEVQGVLNPSEKEFKQGTYFNKGETLLSINSEEIYQNIQSLKSNLLNVIIFMMPDLKVEFPVQYEKWQNYLSEFDLNNTTKELPVVGSDKEKYFLSYRNIFKAFYDVKNLETKFSKYLLKAPFNGILTEAFVTRGTLIRPGQKLGEFIDPNEYELEISVSAELAKYLKIGDVVKITNLEKSNIWDGSIIRINGKINLESQSVKVFVLLGGKGLKEGMYFEAALKASNQKDVIEIPRNLIVNNNEIFIVEDSLLKLQQIILVHSSENTILIKGLEDGMLILTKPLPGAYSGMSVIAKKESDK